MSKHLKPKYYKACPAEDPAECFYCGKACLGILEDPKDQSELFCCLEDAQKHHKIKRFKAWAFKTTTQQKSFKISNNLSVISPKNTAEKPTLTPTIEQQNEMEVSV